MFEKGRARRIVNIERIMRHLSIVFPSQRCLTVNKTPMLFMISCLVLGGHPDGHLNVVFADVSHRP